MSNCAVCGVTLSRDEIGLSIKLFGKNCPEVCCIECISKRFGVQTGRLREIIEAYRADGCQLFADENSPGVL